MCQTLPKAFSKTKVFGKGFEGTSCLGVPDFNAQSVPLDDDLHENLPLLPTVIGL